MDWSVILTVLGTGAAVIGLVYTFLRNFKTDINEKIGKLDARMNVFENRMTSLEERMFWLATGKTLQDAILEERMKLEGK